MTLQNQVCTLEQAKKLKELGVVQKSLFEWIETKIMIAIAICAIVFSVSDSDIIGQQVTVNGQSLTVTGYDERTNQFELSNGAKIRRFYLKELLEKQGKHL